MKVNHENAPHIVLVTTDVRICELKSNGDLVPVTKNKPFIVKRRFDNLAEAKIDEATALKCMLEMAKEQEEAEKRGENA